MFIYQYTFCLMKGDRQNHDFHLKLA